MDVVTRCSRCGDPTPRPLCDDCIGRGGNPIGCLVLAVVVVVIAVAVVLAVAWWGGTRP